MADSSLIDVFTSPEYRRGPAVLELVTLAVLFLVPGLVAPIGLLQFVGLLWLVAAAVTAAHDVARRRAAV